MSVLVTWNGTGYLIPSTNETGWSTTVTNFLADVGNNAVAKTSSGVTLTSSTLNSTSIGLTTPAAGSFTTLKMVSAPLETRVVMAANNVDLSAGSFFTKTVTGVTTFTVSNVPASGFSGSVVMELTNGGAFAVTWWSGVKWAGGVPPVLTASGVDVLGFYTLDGGTTWRGLVLGKAMS